MFGQFRHAFRNAIYGVNSIRSSVSSLDGLRNPSAIARFVIAVGVDPVQGHIGTALSNVGEKVLKQFPSLAKRDTASSVMLKIGTVFSGASEPHVSPNPVGLGKHFAFALVKGLRRFIGHNDGQFIVVSSGGVRRQPTLLRLFNNQFGLEAMK